MKNTLWATLVIVGIALASVASVALHTQGEERSQDIFVVVYNKATEARTSP